MQICIPWDILSCWYSVPGVAHGPVSCANLDILNTFSSPSHSLGPLLDFRQDLFGHFTWNCVLSMGQCVLEMKSDIEGVFFTNFKDFKIYILIEGGGGAKVCVVGEKGGRG